MKTKKGDFIELDFVASIKNGIVFDTTLESEAKKADLVGENDKHKFKPMNVCIGEAMVIKGLDAELSDKEISKEYEIELEPKKAFGMRDAKLIKTVGLGSFKEMPQKGMFVNVDGLIAKVVSLSGGRILLDFNNPLAGKVIIYKIKINKLINDDSEKIRILAKKFALEIENIEVKEREKKMFIKVKDKKKVKKEILKDFEKKIREITRLDCEFN